MFRIFLVRTKISSFISLQFATHISRSTSEQFYFYRSYFYLRLSSFYRIKTMTLFRFRIFCRDSFVLILYVFHIFLVHPVCTISYFWNTHRDLSVAEMLKFCCEVFSFLKRYVLNVFVCILIFLLLSYIFLFYCCKDRILLCDTRSIAYREHSSLFCI